MEDQELQTGNLVENIKEYASIRKELAFLEAVDKSSSVFANTLTGGLVALFGLITLLFFSMAMGFYLSELYGNTYTGWLIVSGFYLLIVLLIFLFKDNYIEPRVMNSIIRKLFKAEPEDKINR